MTDGGSIWFRTAMSAGNLHPVEVYVVDDNVHHYHPLDHALVLPAALDDNRLAGLSEDRSV